MLPKQSKQGLLSLSIAAALSLSGFALSTTPASADSFTNALVGGKVKLDVRARYEDVEDDTVGKEDADVLTVRTRLGYQTGEFMDFDAYVEMENVTAVADDDYNSGTFGMGNRKTEYATIADPEGTELNRYWLGYNGLADTTIRAGRQRIKLDNDRFIGNVGWRQNEQTYDSLTLTNKSLSDTTLFYAYISNVNRIFGNNETNRGVRNKNGDFDMDSHLFNVAYNGWGFGKLVGYGYFLEYEGQGRELLSQQTYGLRFKGATDVGGGVKLLYTAEYAAQDDYKDGANSVAKYGADIDYDYMRLKLGVKVAGISAVLGYEELEGDRYGAFQTPLATLHGQNGWADMFLTTPNGGLEDTTLTLSTTVGGVKLKAVYHDYESEGSFARTTSQRGGDYGDELNLVAVKKFGKYYTILAKYASYDADDYKEDMDKFWLQAGFKF